MKMLSKAAKIVMCVVWGIVILWGAIGAIGIAMVEFPAEGLSKLSMVILSFIPALIAGAVLSLIIWGVDALIRTSRK